MKGVLQHPTIVLELLKHVTPLDYMMLRRASPIFMRNPSVYSSVEDFGFRDFYGCDIINVIYTLLRLHGKEDCFKMDISFMYEYIEIGGVYFIDNTLYIRNLEAVRLRKFSVSTISYAQKYLTSDCNSIHHALRYMFIQISEYERFGFAIELQHNDQDIFDYIENVLKLNFDQLGALWNTRIYFHELSRGSSTSPHCIGIY